MEPAKENPITKKLIIALIIPLSFIIIFNIFQFQKLEKLQSTGLAIKTEQTLNVDVIPKGIPPIYGEELGVSFDDVSIGKAQKADSTIRKLGILDGQISLTGENLKRYIKIVSQISCEYCCGADSIILSDGQAACGCAHSYAMRGLAKYLIQKHNQEYTDDQILEELGKWKTLFFPTQITKKAKILQERGITTNYINLASNKYRGVEQ